MMEQAINHIESLLNGMGFSLWDCAPLQHLLREHTSGTKCVVEPKTYTPDKRAFYEQEFRKRYNRASDEQRQILDMIIDALSNKKGIPEDYFILAAAGTGKTFVLITLIYYMRSIDGTNTCYISMSSTALSAQLLPDGHTAHSTIKLPLEVNDDNVRSAIEFDSPIASQHRLARLLVFDEQLGTQNELTHAVNHYFQELHGNNHPFSGVITVFGGDLCQTLAKVPRARRFDIVRRCFTNSPLFPLFHVMSLKHNYRLSNSLENEQFANFLLHIGNGEIAQDEQGRIVLPDLIHTSPTLEKLIDFVYGHDLTECQPENFSDCAILAPLNSTVQAINKTILNHLPDLPTTYLSNDSELDPDGMVVEDLPPEILNGLNAGGMPLHKLQLKPNSIVLCLRNLSPGVCNGTKIQITHLHQ